MPSGDEVEASENLLPTPRRLQVRKLFLSARVISQKRWVAKHVCPADRPGKDGVPRQPERVVVADMRRDFDRETIGGVTDGGSEFTVGLVVNEKHRGFRNLRRPPVDLESVELVDSELLVQAHIEGGRGEFLATTQLDNDSGLDPSQLAIGDDEEVPTPTGWVDELHRGQFVAELPQRLLGSRLVGDEPVRLLPELVQQERFEDFEDVGLGRVVLSVGSSRFFALDELEHRSKYGW